MEVVMIVGMFPGMPRRIRVQNPRIPRALGQDLNPLSDLCDEGLKAGRFDYGYK
jgi:hypothetical protein